MLLWSDIDQFYQNQSEIHQVIFTDLSENYNRMRYECAKTNMFL
jgi:hypothetical protein